MKKWMFIWGTALLGLAFLVGGVVMVSQGVHTRNEAIETLRAENLDVSDPVVLLAYEGGRAPEGVEVAKVTIDTAEEAHAQAMLIRMHTMTSTEGKTYSELDREDPLRALYITSLTLQDSLHLAHMSLEITRLVIGVGAAFSGLGLATLLLGLPLVRKVID